MCEYPKGPPRVRRPRVVMELSPESAQALSDHAAEHNVMIRDAALDMVRLMDNRETLLFEASDALGATQDKLAASEEARQSAEQKATILTDAVARREDAFNSCSDSLQRVVAMHDEATRQADEWKSRAEQISQDGAAEVNDLSRRLTEALDKADQWEQQCRAAQSDATLVRAALKGWSAMTAWDHVRAAVRAGGVWGRITAGLIGLSLLASALRTIVWAWGMI